jgi:hypothetical protein
VTDEERGRQWCERNGRRPERCTRNGIRVWRWVYDTGPEYALPLPLWDALCSTVGESRFVLESHAYDAVGVAMRELERRAADIRAVLEGGK